MVTFMTRFGPDMRRWLSSSLTESPGRGPKVTEPPHVTITARVESGLFRTIAFTFECGG